MARISRKRSSRSRRSGGDEASVVIAAGPEAVYDVVSDITNMGRLSPECTGGRWIGGADGPAVGARFRGRNRRGLIRWSTTNLVTAANRGREFTFETRQSGARWRYLFEPTGDGTSTIVTERREFWRRQPLWARTATRFALGGTATHHHEMVDGLAATLGRLKELMEQEDAPRGRRGRGRRRGRSAARRR
ncbi:MAG: SRPBCC family protein [Microthrixaceae bacterium]